jgi:hypothetical protein
MNSLPATVGAFYDTVKCISVIIADPWFVNESNQPSITAFLRKITVGDYAIMPSRQQIWAEDIDQINESAVRDRQIFEPCVKAHESWRLEMMSMDYSNCEQLAGDTVPDAGITPDERKFRNSVNDELGHSLTANLHHSGFRTPLWSAEALKPGNSSWKTQLDTGGWVPIKGARDYIEGSGLEDECREKMWSRKAETHYANPLTPGRQSTWHITETDVIVCARKSEMDRCRIMNQVGPFTGVKLPYWACAKHGRSIKSANPIRAALQLTNITDFNTLDLVGSVTHKTNDVAVKDILRTGLRNDYDKDGRLNEGRSSIMADPWGSVDQVKNAYYQRSSGNVRVVLNVIRWWSDFGYDGYDKFECGVEMCVTGAGAILFANVRPCISTAMFGRT